MEEMLLLRSEPANPMDKQVVDDACLSTAIHLLLEVYVTRTHVCMHDYTVHYDGHGFCLSVHSGI